MLLLISKGLTVKKAKLDYKQKVYFITTECQQKSIKKEESIKVLSDQPTNLNEGVID